MAFTVTTQRLQNLRHNSQCYAWPKKVRIWRETWNVVVRQTKRKLGSQQLCCGSPLWHRTRTEPTPAAPLALMSPQVPADHQAGQWCCHSTQIRELQGNMGMGHEMGSKDKNSMLSTGDLVCLTGVCPHNIWVHLHQPVLGYPPRPAEAGCRTTAHLRGATGSNVLILIRKKWWYFHFDGASLGNSPCTLAQQGKNVTVSSG